MPKFCAKNVFKKDKNCFKGHDFGSKKLSELLHNLGHAVSYDEVRQFVTSVAIDQLSRTDNVYVPHGIKPLDSDDTDTFVDAAIDNFDQMRIA